MKKDAANAPDGGKHLPAALATPVAIHPPAITNAANATTKHTANAADTFHVLTANTFEKWIGLFLLTAVIAFGVPLLYGIIWYEKYGNDAKRTLINRLVAFNCWIGIAYLVLKLADVYRYTVGPLPAWFCGFQGSNAVKPFCRTLLKRLN